MIRSLTHRDVHAAAIERHAMWARDFAIVGDLDAALDELRDLRALAAEHEHIELSVDDA